MKPKLPFEYTLVRKSVKNINCRIKNGVVTVSASNRVSIKQIEEFLYSKQDVILDALKKQEKQESHQPSKISNGATIKLADTIFTINIIESNKNQLEVKDNIIYIRTTDTDNEDLVQKIFDKLLVEYSKRTILPISKEVFELLKPYNIPSPEIKFKKMKSMWGNCNSRKCVITFSTNLMYTNIDFIKYVVLHEFTHLIHQNHQKEFYDVIAEFMPNYKKIKGNLYE